MIEYKDVILFLEQIYNFAFIKCGSGYRCKEHFSLAVKSDRLSWYWHSRGIGGFGALDYLMKIDNLSFSEAIKQLVNIEAIPRPPEPPKTDFKSLVLPKKAPNCDIIIDYLCNKRKLNWGIVEALIQDNLIYQDERKNVVFVGHENKFACLRSTSTSFRMDCSGSDKKYSFNLTCSGNGKLYIFESAIDLLSHATLENIYKNDINAWKNDNRLSLGGTSSLAIDEYIKRNPVTEMIFCLDNDEAGREKAVAFRRKYSALGFYTRIELPQNKDYNDDLVKFIQRKENDINECKKEIYL